MIKLKLAEVMQLQQEVGMLLEMEITFPLKFRLETKLLPTINSTLKLIAKEVEDLALSNGAVKDVDKIWKFEKDENDEVINKELYGNFQTAYNKFIQSEENEIEFEHTINESLFNGLTTGTGFPAPSVISKLIV